MNRFFIEESLQVGDTIHIHDKALKKRIIQVNRLRANDHLFFFNNTGYEYEAEILVTTNRGVSVRILRQYLGLHEPPCTLVLYQALLKGSRWDFLLEKGVEIGISQFVPLVTQYSVVRTLSPQKYRRYAELIVEATEQCGGVRLALCSELMLFSSAVESCASQHGLKFIACPESEGAIPLASIRVPKQSQPMIHLFIGPEGGFSAEEVELAKANGFIQVDLGVRILRSETAGLVFGSYCLSSGVLKM